MGDSRKHKIIIAEDHSTLSEGLGMLFEHAGYEVAVKVSNYAKLQLALDKIGEKNLVHYILILDLVMQGKHGLDKIKDIKSRYHHLKILIFTGQSEDDFGIRCLRSGASGFLSKTEPFSQVMKAVEALSQGQHYASEHLKATLINALDPTGYDTTRHKGLTDREAEVFSLIGMGYSTKEIASSLSLSEKTIAAHREQIRKKLKIANASKLVHIATIAASQSEKSDKNTK